MLRVDQQDVTSHSAKTEALTTYFKSIIGVSGVSSVEDLTGLYSTSAQPSNALVSEFTEEETKAAILAMNTNSAPGPDGFGPAFYKSTWPHVKSKIMEFLRAFHRGQAQLERINRSHIVLLPKKVAAVEVEAFKPICLQNCSLKILSKVLTARLQKEIPRLIDIHQTGFIKGRSITDTFIYALELVQVCHKRKRPAIVLKLDFAKAFDTVNWDGLSNVLNARGFCQKRVNWMSHILSSSKTSILVNGCPGPWITCKRGLRQGDPISPYLFLLVAETLQRMVTNCTAISHPTDDALPCAVLQYADDTLIVFRATQAAATCLREILDSFAGITGLHINFSKSTLVPIHVDVQVLNSCVNILGCRKESFPQQYLGLPLSMNKLPVLAFGPYIHKADKYLGSWQASLLNIMGRTVLVNAVLDALLVYFMSSVQLPPAVIHQMDKKRRAFLWSGDVTGHSSASACLVAWLNVCKPKEQGGLGIKDLGVQNICLLLKLVHKLHCPTSSAWA